MDGKGKTILDDVNVHIKPDHNGSTWFTISFCEVRDEEGSTIQMKDAIQILLLLLEFLNINHNIEISNAFNEDDLVKILSFGVVVRADRFRRHYDFPSIQSYLGNHISLCLQHIKANRPDMTILFPNLVIAEKFYEYLN